MTTEPSLAERGVKQIDEAKPADDAALKRIIATTPMAGSFRLAYEREPSFFQAVSLLGRQTDVLAVRNFADEAIGMGTRGVYPAHLNGEPVALGYLSNLRISEEYRHGRSLFRGYQAMADLHRRKNDVHLYVSTIIADNTRVLGLLQSGRLGLPTYHARGKYITHVLPVRSKCRPLKDNTLSIRNAQESDLPAILALLGRFGQTRQFSPRWTAEDFHIHSPADPLLDDLFLAEREGRLIGCLGLWNQSAVKQLRILGYTAGFAFLRTVLNGLAPLLRYPKLPGPGKLLKHAYVSHLAVDQDAPAVYGQLLSAVHNRAAQQGISFLFAGLHEQDPLRQGLAGWKTIEYPAELFTVYWPDGKDLNEQVDARVPYLELALL